MSIQSNINATMASFAGIKKAHDIEIAKQANKKMEEQQLAIREQRLNIQKYREQTKRKRLNLEIRQIRQEEKKDNGREQK
jgi:electron transfer flavoprotein alpha/beta subunit